MLGWNVNVDGVYVRMYVKNGECGCVCDGDEEEKDERGRVDDEVSNERKSARKGRARN